MEKITLREKINNKMDHLQTLMEGQAHIDRPEYVKDVISWVSKFWSVLSEEDKDYIHGAQYALEEKMEWKV
jgi:hypothetical protein